MTHQQEAKCQNMTAYPTCLDDTPYDCSSLKLCPRCGKAYLNYPALSRYFDLYICPDCGMDEAFSGNIPLKEWACWRGKE